MMTRRQKVAPAQPGARNQPRAAARSQRAPRRRRQAPQGGSLYETVSLDPLNQQFSGAKVPDNDSTLSTALRIETILTMTPDSSGQAAIRIAPGCTSELYCEPTGFTGDVVTSWSAPVVTRDHSLLESNFSAYRVVAAGIELEYTGNNLNNAGDMVVHMLGPSDEPLNGLALRPNTAYGTSQARQSHRYDSHVKIVAKKTSIEATHYENLDTTFEALDSWCWYGIFVTGADGTTPQSTRVRIVQHLELLPVASSFASLTASPAARSSPSILTRVANAVRSMPVSWEAVGNAARVAGQAFNAYRHSGFHMPLQRLNMNSARLSIMN